MNTNYTWLPSMIDCTKFKNHYDFINHLYLIFSTDFKNKRNQLFYKKIIVRYAPKILDCSQYIVQGHCDNSQYNCINCSYAGREDIFNHITCCNNYNQRIPGLFDLQRAIRLNWIRLIIENYEKQEVLFFEEPSKKKGMTIYFWLKNVEYLVIVRRTKNNQLFLTTAFYVEKSSNYARNLKKKYDKYNVKKTPTAS